MYQINKTKIFIAVCLLTSCKLFLPRSYCSLDTKTGIISLADTNIINTVTISQEDTFYGFKDLGLKNVQLDLSLILNKESIIRVTTSNFRDEYKLSLNPDKLLKKRKIKFINQIR